MFKWYNNKLVIIMEVYKIIIQKFKNKMKN